MKKLLLSAVISAALLTSVQGQTNSPAQAQSITQALDNLWRALSANSTNWLFEAHALYAPKLQLKYGGGVGAFYPFDKYVFAGTRLDWVDGGFWMPSGNAGVQLPINLFGKVKISPFGYAGIGIPLSGAKTPARDNNGNPTAILGYGAEVHIWSSSDGKISIGAVADSESWSGFAGRQYRGGILAHFSF